MDDKRRTRVLVVGDDRSFVELLAVGYYVRRAYCPACHWLLGPLPVCGRDQTCRSGALGG
jgi:hypothetical protein